MRVLVTGGAGFLGSSLVEHLLELGDDIVVLDNFWRGKPENLGHIIDEITLLESDACDTTSYDEVQDPDSIDVVYHLAAINGTKWFHEEARMVMDVNINSTLRAIEFAEKHHCRFVFTSSPEAYGDSEVMPLGGLESSIFTHPSYHQRHAYGGSKYLGELAVQHAVRQGLDGRIVRPFNGYGPRLGQDEYGQVVTMMLRSALDKGIVHVHGDGTQTRSLTWVDDIVRGIALSGRMDSCLESGDSLAGRSFNLGSTEEISMIDLGKAISQLVHERSDRLVEIEMAEGYPGDSARRLPNLVDAKDSLGWSAITTLDSGLSQTLDSML
jgi:nucleoside-diphosphate-sugar epimerase